MLEAAPSLASFVERPFDRCVTVPSLFAWHQGKSRSGFLALGALDRPAVRTLFEALEMDLHPEAEPHVSIADFRDVAYVDLAAMGLFLELLKVNMPRFGQKVRKRLLLCPTGERGILLGGLKFQLPSPYDVRLGTELASFLPWLGIDEADPLLAWLDQQRTIVTGEDELTRALRLALEGGAATVAECARQVGCSERSLQRSLEARGTTFRDLRLRHRVEKARVLLAGSRTSLSEIAGLCGFATQQHFTTAFRAAIGKTPAVFRAEASGAREG